MTSMAWQTTGDVAEFLAAAGPYLRRERVRNTVILTVTETMRVTSAVADGAAQAGDPATRPLLGWWSDPSDHPSGPSDPSDPAGDVAGAFLHTPQFPVVLTAVAPAVAAELAAVTLADRPLPGVNAQPEVAEAFAAAWQKAHRGRVGGRADIRADVRVHVSQRLYRLAELSWPDPAPDGTARTAAGSDVPLLADWFTAFAFEVHDMGRGVDQAAAVRERVSYGGITIWEAGGRPVAMAGATRQVARMARIGPVYTPPERRGRGYGSAATAAASAGLLEAGAEDVLLYTDLANPVSNSIYQRIGYRAVEDRIVLAFTAD
jgi:GNAT superfamily N-acetyltransferase